MQPRVRTLADQAFSRVAGAPLVEGNRVRLLKDAAENYPAWLDAIAAARRYVYFESYIIREDAIGERFARALLDAAERGVRVRLIYDWLGAVGKTSRGFWSRLRAGGVEVRCYNPPRFDSPLGWLSRDHRKMVSVDGEVGFVTGLCVGQMWAGDPAKNIEPWRDTGVEIRGPAVADVERAFIDMWRGLGEPIPEEERWSTHEPYELGATSVRIVAGEPASGGLFRVDQLVAALARKRLWLTDAYYAGTTAYVKGLKSAAASGVDVRLLVPGGSDIPIVKVVSRAGYRPLLEAGVRVFEWNGTMLHAKTAVADGRWARVGSTNLNLASWLGNCELDAVIEDEAFALQMEEMYRADLENATEIVLDERHKLRAPARSRGSILTSGGGSGGRAAAGAMRITNTLGAAFTNRRVLEPVEARTMMIGGGGLLILAVLFAFFPALLAYPLAALFVWVALALLYRGYKLHRAGKAQHRPPPPTP